MPFLVPAATFSLLLGAVILFLGVAVLRDGARERLHRVTALMLFFGGLGALLAGLSLALRASTPEGTTVFTNVALHFASAWEFFFPSLLLFTLVFPTEHSLLRRFGWLQEAIFVPYLFHLVLTLVADYSHGNFFVPEVVKLLPWASALLTPVRVGLSLLYEVHQVLFSLVNLGYVALTLTVLVLRARRAANPRLQDQMRVMVWGLGTCLLLYSLVAPVPTLLGGGSNPWERYTGPLLVLSLAVGSGSIAYSIIRHRFLDTRLLVRRSLTFLAAAGVLAVLYLLVMRRVEGFIASFSTLDITLIEPLFLMIALVMLQPVVIRVEELMDRWVLRDRREGRVVLERLSRDIATLMDLPSLGTRLTRSVFESMVTEGVALLARSTPEGRIELVGSAGFPGAPPGVWERLAAGLVALTGAERPVSVRELGLRGESPEAVKLAAAANEIPLALLVPLEYQGRLLGALVLGPKATRTRYTAEDLAVLVTLGNQTATALRNTHLLHENLKRAALEEELHLARQIQASYLPSTFPRLERLELSGINVPSKQVGGDYYDYVEMSHGLLVTVADVVGKGVPAALLMSMMQASLRTMAAERRSLSEMLHHLNQLVLGSGMAGKFATMFLGRLDVDTCTLHFSNAGHNPPCLLRADGEVRWLSEGGLLLGVLADPRPTEHQVRLFPGDRLVLYTDGITEAANAANEFFGEDRLTAVLGEMPAELDAESVTRGVMDAVHRFCGDREPGDDMTVMVLRVPLHAPVHA